MNSTRKEAELIMTLGELAYNMQYKYLYRIKEAALKYESR